MHAHDTEDLRGIQHRLAVQPTEAAALLSVSRTTMFELIRSGRVHSLKVGKRRLIPVAELERFLIAGSEGGDAA